MADTSIASTPSTVSIPITTTTTANTTSPNGGVHIHLPPQLKPEQTQRRAYHSSNYIKALHELSDEWGISKQGKLVNLAFQGDGIQQLACMECKNKQLKACSVEFAIGLEISPTSQYAQIACNNVICVDCITKDTVKWKLGTLRRMKSNPRASPCARKFVDCFAPLIRLCGGNELVITCEKLVDISRALILVILGCLCVFWLFLYRPK